MHMHQVAQCVNCGARRVLSTPIPSIVILSSMCEACGWFDLVGMDGDRLCRPCLDIHHDDVRREVGHSGEPA